MTSAKQIASLLRETRSVVLVLHRQPDGDAIGSAVALTLALPSRRVRIVCATAIPSVFRSMLGSLTVVTALPRGAQIYAVLDCPDLKRTGFAVELAKLSGRKRIVVIDHHQSGDLEHIATDYLFDQTVSSTCELVARIIDALRVPIVPEIATALLLGIHTDTGGLRHSNTTSSTLRLVAQLIRQGAAFEEIHSLFSPRRDLKKLRLWGNILGSVSINSMGIVVARVTKQTLATTGAEQRDLAGLAKYLCAIEGTKAALVLVETERGWRGSLRTRSRTFNVGRLAKLLGGNGGKKVAGFLATEELVSDKRHLFN